MKHQCSDFRSFKELSDLFCIQQKVKHREIKTLVQTCEKKAEWHQFECAWTASISIRAERVIQTDKPWPSALSIKQHASWRTDALLCNLEKDFSSLSLETVGISECTIRILTSLSRVQYAFCSPCYLWQQWWKYILSSSSLVTLLKVYTEKKTFRNLAAIAEASYKGLYSSSTKKKMPPHFEKQSELRG